MKRQNTPESDHTAAYPIVLSDRARRYLPVKRAIDFISAIVFLLLASVPCCVITLLVWATSRGPAIFAQTRIGKDGKPFRCYKFRTMYANAPKYCATPDFQDAEKYITPLGKLLRKTSLDELPQIFNVLKGDMSFIGPRPLIPDEKEIHEERIRRGIYAIRPGISGLAQINGRDRVEADAKVAYDEQYLRNLCITFDIRILLGTLFGVLKGNDIVEGQK